METDLLYNAGWNEQRHTDISNALLLLEKEGYKISKQLKEILSSYDKLIIEFKNPINYIDDILELNIEKGIENNFKENIDLYSKKINKELVILGECYRGNAVLLADQMGEVYVGIDEQLYFVGKNIKDAIKTISSNSQLINVEDEDYKSLTPPIPPKPHRGWSVFDGIDD